MPLPIPMSMRRDAAPGLEVKPVQLTKLELPFNYSAEYVFKGDNAIIHYFRTEGLFPQSFRGRLYRAFQAWPGDIVIEWIDELHSWCVTVKGGGRTPPGSDDIEDIISAAVMS